MRKINLFLTAGLIFLVTLGLLFLTQSRTISRPQVIPMESTPPPPDEIPPEMLERLLKEHEEQFKQMTEEMEAREPKRVSGPETAGSIIHVNGKEIKLKDDVYVEAVIATTICVEGAFYPKTPYYALRIKDSNEAIGVVAEDGMLLDDQRATPEEQARTLEKFQWLRDELEKGE